MTFEETQKFAPWALWIGRVTALLVVGVFAYLYLSYDLPPASLVVMAIALPAAVLPCLLLDYSRLRTKIDLQGIQMRFKPFSSKQFAWSEIDKAEVVDYGFIGGWGVRIGTRYGTVYNTQGKEGLFLTLKNGKTLIVGTQKKDEVSKIVSQYLG